MFYGCSSLISLNLHKLFLSNNLSEYWVNDIFQNCNENLIMCIDNEDNIDDDNNE